MLATFVIGLREGLEAALIVGIIAAFLKRNGRSLAAMWIGVGIALALSVAVGVILEIVESSLPQRAQEGLETIIGAIAIVFVTSMIVWMRTNARGLKAELEEAASAALAGGTTRALAVMAFLAVLKEGFETAVFLLATFQAAGNVTAAASGAVLGVLVAVILGYGIYRGGVRLNLSKFFTYTGFFLVLVAAGLVVTALGTAHEAGWLNAGQQRTLNLTTLAQGGTVHGALLTGVLGIPASPTLIQLLGWFAYLVPMMVYLYLPQRFRPAPPLAMRLCWAGAATSVVLAAALALFVPDMKMSMSTQAPVQGGGTVQLNGSRLTTPNGPVQLGAETPDLRAGVALSRRDATGSDQQQSQTTKLDATQVATLNGGRLPVGVDPTQNPGPYQASYSSSSQTSAWILNGSLIDASSTATDVVTISGGGLSTPRTFTVAPGQQVPGPHSSGRSWSVATSYVNSMAHRLQQQPNRAADHRFWARFVPVILVVLACALAALAERARRRLRPRRSPSTAPETSAALS